MNLRCPFLLALVASPLIGQPLENFSNLVRPGETFFAGDWATRGEQPAATLRQASGAFEIRGTNNSRSYVDIYRAAGGTYFSIGSNRYLAVSAMPLAGNQGGFFRVLLLDAGGRIASATFLLPDFSAAGFRTVTQPLSSAPGFDFNAIERIRISGDVAQGASDFAFAFDDLAAVPTGPVVDGALRNFSARNQAGTGTSTSMIGFVIEGGAGKSVLLRAVGPGLAPFGVAGFVADPQLQVFRGNLAIAANDNWGGDAAIDNAFRRVGAFALAAGGRDAAIVTTLNPGAYTAQLGGTGVGLLELYDLDEAPANQRQRFTNLAARGVVGTGAAQFTAGFVIDGAMARRYLLRLAGPALAGVGLGSGFVADPRLRLTRTVGGSDFLVRDNDDWQTGNDGAQLSDAAAKAGAFPFPAGSRDAAMLITLPPGTYLAAATATANQTGFALLEMYEIPW